MFTKKGMGAQGCND